MGVGVEASAVVNMSAASSMTDVVPPADGRRNSTVRSGDTGAAGPRSEAILSPTSFTMDRRMFRRRMLPAHTVGHLEVEAVGGAANIDLHFVKLAFQMQATVLECPIG